MIGWQASLLVFLKTFSEILTAGIAITGFSLLLYAMAFNLRDRVARTFAMILIFTVIVYTAEAIGSIENSPASITFWLHLQWVGIVFLPTAYLHFSDALLSTTGKPSRGRRRLAVRISYIGSVIFLFGLPFSYLVGPVVIDAPAPHLRPTTFTDIFVGLYVLAIVTSWFNFLRAYRRTTTTATRRRMFYLITGSVAPALGAFPFLPYGPNFAAQHQLTFWSLSVLTSIFVGVLLIVMAYAVAFFGVSWPDRVVRMRLFKWIMRGPFTASITLAATTLIRRGGEAFGSPYTALVPIVMVGVILLSEYLITLFAPMGERWLFYGKDRSELDRLHSLENQLLTQNDLKQFFEMVLATACDLLQARGGYVAALDSDGLELVVTTGWNRFHDEKSPGSIEDDLLKKVYENRLHTDLFSWGEDLLFPLLNGTTEQPELIGLLGISGAAHKALDEEQAQAMETLSERASLALQSRRVQQKIFLSLDALSTGVDLIQRLRAAGQYNPVNLLANEQNLPQENDLAEWVKDALSHYWGGPKLTQNPLMRFKIVQDALEDHDGNNANALRAILREAIDRIRPEGERRFTAEWILYNILEMKFVEGRKVREVALRLAMSEADLYRKQRIAVEAVAKTIGEMEVEARKESAG
jgi:hypothetical protein